MSFGGKVAIALTEFVPRLVRRIVLVDSLPGSERDRSRHIADFLDGPATFASFDELLSRLTTFNPTRSPASLRRGALHNAIELPDGRWRWRHERGVRDEAHDQRLEKRAESDSALWQRLSHLEIPIMLARGMRPNSVLRDDDEARFLSAVPDGRVAHFDEAGHSIQGDMPLELAAHIRAFANLSRGNRHESHGPTQ
jgi:pimeloyl-ACP methyl ester carboxylesterase